MAYSVILAYSSSSRPFINELMPLTLRLLRQGPAAAPIIE